MYYMIIFLFNIVWLNFIFINISYYGLFPNNGMHRAMGGGGINRKVMFNDKGGRRGLGKSDFCDKGEGWGLGYPKFA